MSEKPENPRAFPLPVSDHNQGYEGMSLRDYYAGQAMQAYVGLEPHRQGLNAVMAYKQADEMLKVRQS